MILFWIFISSASWCIVADFPDSDTFVMTENKCITNSTCALFAIPPANKILSYTNRVSDFSAKSYLNCEFRIEDRCNQYWDVYNWRILDSVDDKSDIGEIITDRRWEDFYTFILKDAGKNLNFVDTEINLPATDFKIPISMRTDEAHILLCNEESVKKSACIWFKLSEEKSSLRKCKENGISSEDDCSKLIEEVQHPKDFPKYLSSKKWSHVILEKQENTLKLRSSDQTTIIKYTSDKLSQMRRLFFQAKRQHGLMKVHKYSFLYSEKDETVQLGPEIHSSVACLAMLVKMCRFCKINIILTETSNKILYKSEYSVYKWTEIKLKLPERSNYAQLYIQTSVENSSKTRAFWAVGGFRECNEFDFRSIAKTAEEECELVTDTDESYVIENVEVNTDEVSPCAENSFGLKHCISCKEMNVKESCTKTKYCELGTDKTSTCVCTAGYSGKYCSKCINGNYGHSCKMSCHHCSGCNHVDGRCSGACKDNYKGDKCDIPSAPILQSLPNISNIESQSAKITVVRFSYIGNPKPTHYRIEYKRKSDLQWTTQFEGDFNNIYSGKLNSLSADTDYNLRVVLFDGTSPSLLNTDLAPVQHFTTTCAKIQPNQLKVDASNTSATIVLKDNQKDSCKLKNYIILEKNLSYSKKGDEIQLNNLNPYTEYDIFLTREDHKVPIWFKTQEGVPSKVKNIKVTSRTSNSLSIEWKEPDQLNGIVFQYGISYKVIKARACKYPTNGQPKYTTSVDASIILTDLKSYTQYEIEIYGFTKAGPGEGSTIQDYTSQTDDVEETLDVSLEPKSTYVLVKLKANVECESIKGGIKIFASTKCSNEWCKDISTKNQSYSEPSNLSLNNLYPFSNYTLELKLCRNESCFRPKLITRDYRTFGKEPSEVRDVILISKGSNYFYFRWLPPYPPTGTIERYRIFYQYDTWRSTYNYNDRFTPKNCILWPEYICHRITNKIYEGYKYAFQIFAVNAHQQETINPTVFEEFSEEEKSYPPFNITTEWNSNVLQISWIRPNRTNGQLNIFKLNGKKILIPEYKLIFVEELQLKCEQIFNIAISACNSAGCSEEAKKRQIIPPCRPKLDHNILWTNTNNTINITIPSFEKNCQKCSTYIIVSVNASTEQNRSTFEPVIFESELKDIPELPFTITIGNNGTMESTYLQKMLNNSALNPGTFYNISVKIENNYLGEKSYTVKNLLTYTTGDANVFIGLPQEESSSNVIYILFIIIPVIALGIFIYMRKKKNKPKTDAIARSSQLLPPVNNEREILMSNMENIGSIIEKPVIKIKPNVSKTNKMPGTTYSKLISLDNYEMYVKKSLENGELKNQHDLFPRGQTKPWTYAAMKVNKPKNRYVNLLAYDHSRVKLEKIDNDEYSDYINASYIDGYKTPNAYIATQGPKQSTLDDFWGMIWQENVEHIVMLANIYEGGKKKVEQYWPNINESLEFRDITVKFTSEEIFANYTYRVFKVSNGSSLRTVYHLHFTRWPDHGIPLYSQSLVPFLRKILDIKSTPIVVHCSAGVGRTGTIILCDMSLRMAEAEQKVDVFNHLEYIRTRRANLVDNYEQYKLVHLVILEYLFGIKTHIPCNDQMNSAISQVLQGDVDKQMKYLEEIEWQDQAMKTIIEDEYENFAVHTNKNRFNDIVPEKSGRIFLSCYPSNDESSSYINAVFVDGFNHPNRFIATQQPMPNTLGDFWRLIVESGCSVVISLNEINTTDKTCCQFWPNDNGEMQPTEFIKVCHDKTEVYELFDLVCVTITESKNDYTSSIDILVLKNWNNFELLPKNLHELLSFMMEADSLTRNSIPIIVTCYDGTTACGIFLSLSFIIEKMKLEHECDVCQAVRYVRHNRRQFIRNKAQFIFLYKSALEYIKNFQSYSNFS